MSDTQKFMQAAFDAAHKGMTDGQGGPFGAVIVKDGKIISTGANQVVRSHDPTGHAEVTAIRAACQALRTHVLDGCTIYSTCEPCPMCLAAIYWARLDRVVYAATREEAAKIGFDDALIYEEIALPIEQRKLPMMRLETPAAKGLFDAWTYHPTKVPY